MWRTLGQFPGQFQKRVPWRARAAGAGALIVIVAAAGRVVAAAGRVVDGAGRGVAADDDDAHLDPHLDPHNPHLDPHRYRQTSR